MTPKVVNAKSSILSILRLLSYTVYLLLSVFLIIQIFNFFFPCLHELDGFLNGHHLLSSNLFVPDHDQSSEVWNCYPWLGLSKSTLSLLPLNNYTVSLHFFTMLSSLHLCTWPNHLDLLLLMQFLMLSRPKRSLSSEESFLSDKYCITIRNLCHLTILRSTEQILIQTNASWIYIAVMLKQL